MFEKELKVPFSAPLSELYTEVQTYGCRATIKQVLHVLMRDGLKVDYGQKIGKTIIFAKNHDHAEKILEVFNKQYPELSKNGQPFAKVIDNYMTYAQRIH